MADPLIRARGLYVGYGGAAVVRGIDLDVGAGEVVALLGPNGAGKTTVLRAMSALVEPMSGSIEVFGSPLGRPAPHRLARRGLAHLPEDRSLFLDLTVEENLLLGLRGSRRARHSGREHALEMMPELRRLASRRAALLSGGEQQMLALARALVGDPKCLLIDEMSLGLAPIIVERLLPIVRDIAEQRGVGVLIVEQHVPMALEVADRAYVMVNGSIKLEGAADDLADQPALLESSYLGEMGEVADRLH